MENVTPYIKAIEKATDGKSIRSSMVSALNALNSNSTGSAASYSAIPVTTINDICKR